MSRIAIIPRLYQLQVISAHDTETSVFTDASVCSEAEYLAWDRGGVVSTEVSYADESIDGHVNWLDSAEGRLCE